MAALALDAATEQVAVNLLRHLEWQADGFSLVFVFADVGPSLQLAEWLDERLALQGQPLQRAEASDDFMREPEAAVVRRARNRRRAVAISFGGGAGQAHRRPRGAAAVAPVVAPAEPEPVRSLAAQERAAVLAAMAEAEGNLSAAARTLGLSRAALYRRLDKHGL